jgi:MFS transporter, SP family, major inositol transporter
VYIGEISSPKFRGALASTPSLVFAFGMMVVYILGAFHLPWNIVAIAAAVVPLTALIALFFLPESPVWLQARGKYNEAEDAMLWLCRTPQECQE